MALAMRLAHTTVESFVVFAVACILGLAIVSYMDPSEFTSVVWVIFTLLALGALSFVLLSSRGGVAPLEIGSVYLAVVLLYALVPLIFYLLLGGTYTPFNDARLYSIAPSARDVSRIGYYYLTYAASFVLAYLCVRGSRSVERTRYTEPDAATLFALITILIVLRFFLLLANVLFAEGVTSYIGTYTRFNHLPLLAQQILGHLGGMSLTVGVAAIVAAAGNWLRFRVLVLSWLAVEAIVLAVGLGARTAFFVLCIALVVSLHIRHRPFRTVSLIILGGLLVFVFLLLGVFRSGTSEGLEGPIVAIARTASEFESLFANAIDIDRLKLNGDLENSTVLIAAYLGDIFALFPQQMLPFEKVSLPDWYVTTHYPEFAESGGGLAFGAIAESIVGNGMIDIILRGVGIGIIYGAIERACNRGFVSYWKCVLYVWMVCFCYQTFRSTTGSLLPMFAFHFIPSVIAVRMLAYLLRNQPAR